MKCVIVESPSKCKKIEEILGDGYKCIASYGHLREMKDYKYTIIEGKKKHIDSIKNLIKSSSEVILATDKDREGEAIAWHICDIFNLSIEKTKRISFSSITKEAIMASLKNHETIDMKLVESQKTRQIIDYMIGYKISPLLWRKITTKLKLSAGRCQTPALKIIYDNEKENDNRVYDYKTIGYFTQQCIPFHLNHKFKKIEEVNVFLEASINKEYIMNVNNLGKYFYKSPLPLSTNRLQQLSNQKLSFSPKDTMRICQSLYEKGHITYMRTETQCYSNDFIEEMTVYIKKSIRQAKIKDELDMITMKKNEAHESIRPTYINKDVKLEGNEKKLYTMIRNITIESFLEDCQYNKYEFYIESENYKYIHYEEVIDVIGWRYKETIENKYAYLSNIRKVNCLSIRSEESIHHKKQHYSESKLLQILESKGIGRPSTFANIVDTIQSRGYVKRMNIKGKEEEMNILELNDNQIQITKEKKIYGQEKNKLVLQPIGEMVVELLYEKIKDLFDYGYTKYMEDSLDLIIRGEIKGEHIIDELDKKITSLLDSITKDKIKIKIDEEHTFLVGKYGPVIQKKNGEFLKVREDIQMDDLKQYTLEMLLHENKICGQYNGNDMVIKSGKYGKYLEVNGVHYSLKNKDLDQNEEYYIDMIENKRITNSYLRELTPEMSIRKGKYGYYIFFNGKKKNISLKHFKGDIENCSVEEINNWINK